MIKQSNQLTLSHKDDCITRKDTNYCMIKNDTHYATFSHIYDAMFDSKLEISITNLNCFKRKGMFKFLAQIDMCT